MEELLIMRWIKIIQNKIGTEMSPFFYFLNSWDVRSVIFSGVWRLCQVWLIKKYIC